LNTINILDKSIADELLAKGFHYIKQKINDNDVYCFVNTPELSNLIQSNYLKQDFFISKFMNF
jgi:hypothetical protein